MKKLLNALVLSTLFISGVGAAQSRYQLPENSPCAYAAQQITRAIVEADQRRIRPEQSETWQRLKSEPGLNGINLSALLREGMDIKMNIANPTARDIFGGIEIACKRY